MQQGSIVVMVSGLSELDKSLLRTVHISRWPEPSDTPLVVTGMHKDDTLISRVGITIDLYPEMQEKNVFIDISLFREVLPPGEVSIEDIIKEKQLALYKN